jgi:uncharacterized cupin superfamily protein
MNVAIANLLTAELESPLDEAGFRHRGAELGLRIGAERIGAGLYEAEAGTPIWPYHYHYPSEEWLYVIAGSPVLRDPGGERALMVGDVVCFPAGHAGAHTIAGPGRFVILSDNEAPGPWVSVYPDSNKVSLAPGTFDAPPLNRLILSRDDVVDYWQGEGTADPARPAPVPREPAAPPRPVINVLSVDVDAPPREAPVGLRSRTRQLGPLLGARSLGSTLHELAPGEGTAPYHYECGREEWAVVLTGALALRHPGGERALTAGDVVCFPEGSRGAHRLINRDDAVARVLLVSTKMLPASICYPDSGTWVMRHGPEAPDIVHFQAAPHPWWEN